MTIILAKNGIQLEPWQVWGLAVLLALTVVCLIILAVLGIGERKQGEKKNDVREMDSRHAGRRRPDA